jgi:hypothetical protein
MSIFHVVQTRYVAFAITFMSFAYNINFVYITLSTAKRGHRIQCYTHFLRAIKINNQLLSIFKLKRVMTPTNIILRIMSLVLKL